MRGARVQRRVSNRAAAAAAYFRPFAPPRARDRRQICASLLSKISCACATNLWAPAAFRTSIGIFQPAPAESQVGSDVASVLTTAGADRADQKEYFHLCKAALRFRVKRN